MPHFYILSLTMIRYAHGSGSDCLPYLCSTTTAVTDTVSHAAAAEFPGTASPFSSATISGSADSTTAAVFTDFQVAPWEPFNSAYPLCCISSTAEHFPSVTSPATPVAATAATESAQD